jgi:hypothetical protein
MDAADIQAWTAVHVEVTRAIVARAPASSRRAVFATLPAMSHAARSNASEILMPGVGVHLGPMFLAQTKVRVGDR